MLDDNNAHDDDICPDFPNCPCGGEEITLTEFLMMGLEEYGQQVGPIQVADLGRAIGELLGATHRGIAGKTPAGAQTFMAAFQLGYLEGVQVPSAAKN